MQMRRRRAGAFVAVAAAVCALPLTGCARLHDGKAATPPVLSGVEPLGQTAALPPDTGPAATDAASAVPATATLATIARSVLAASPVVARLTRQGGAPIVRTSRWTPGNGPAAEGIAIQLVYRKDVRLLGVVPLVTPTGAASYRVEKMRVDATARRFLVYVDARSGSPEVVGITAGE